MARKPGKKFFPGSEENLPDVPGKVYKKRKETIEEVCLMITDKHGKETREEMEANSAPRCARGAVKENIYEEK